MKPVERHELALLFDHVPSQQLQFPNLDMVDWGVIDYLGWTHSSGHIGYAVVETGAGLRGLAFRRALTRAPRRHAHMCGWCHTLHRADGVAMFSHDVDGSDGRRSIGLFLCKQLDCSLRLRNLTGDETLMMPETIDLQGRIARLQRSISQFVSRLSPTADR